MNTSYIKKIAIISMLFILMILLPTFSHASNIEVALVKSGEDYIIYVKDMEDKNFQFSFTNNDLSEEEAKTGLTFIQNWDDTNGVNVACLEKGTVDSSKDVYLWIKEGENLYSVKLNLSKAITKEDMENVENLTNKIDTETGKYTTETETDGVKKTVTLGELDITDSKEAEYKYQLIKIDGNESEKVKVLNELLDELKNNYTGMKMFEKVMLVSSINQAYDNVLADAELSDVEYMVIYQPEESKDGDKYLVILQKVCDGEIVNDIKILNCTREYNAETVKEKNIIKTTSVLPVTFDSIVLIVILGALAVTIVAVVIRMKKLSVKNNEK